MKKIPELISGRQLLGRPDAGWSYLLLNGEIVNEISYLTDVPTEWLREAIRGLNEGRPFLLSGFCEPGWQHLLVGYQACHAVYVDCSGKAYEPKTEIVGIIEFCKRLHADITLDLEDWADWLPTQDREAAKARNRETLVSLLAELASAIEKAEQQRAKDYSYLV